MAKKTPKPKYPKKIKPRQDTHTLINHLLANLKTRTSELQIEMQNCEGEDDEIQDLIISLENYKENV